MSGFAPPVADSQPVAGQSGRKKLTPGVIRNRVGTWVTNKDGKSAFYVRKAAEVGSFDFNSCGEYPPAYPSHESFEDTLDEDEYSIDSCPCTGSFAFTLHPEEYQSLGHSSHNDGDEDSDVDADDYGGGVPVSSVSIRRTPTNHAQDIGTTWVSESWLGLQQEGTPIPPRCAALISLAASVDEARDHISTLYRHRDRVDGDIVSVRTVLRTHTTQMAEKINSLWDHMVQRTSSASEAALDARVSGMIATHLQPIQHALSAMDCRLTDLSTSITSRLDTLERQCSDHDDSLTALTARVTSFDVSLSDYKAIVDAEFVVMDSRITAIPTPNLDACSLSKSGRASLSAFEKSVKKRLSDHAAKLADNLHRRKDVSTSAVGNKVHHGTGISRVDEGQKKDTTGWSVASDSQYSQDAPADHEGLPRPLRGGGGMGSPSPSPSRSAAGSSSRSQGSVRASPESLEASNTVVTSNHSGQTASGTVGVGHPPMDSSQVEPRAPRFPTPWANSSFYNRNNPSDRASQRDTTTLGKDGEAPPELHLHGCTYTRRESDSQGPPDAILHLPPDTLSVSPMGKVWHGGGSLASFGTGERVLSREALVSLGVPFPVIPAVVASHAQLVGIWNRPQTASSHDRYSPYDSSTSRSPSYLQSDALKFPGWTDLPQSGVTPEKWVEFYTSLQLMALQYGIGIMPFEGLVLQYAQSSTEAEFMGASDFGKMMLYIRSILWDLGLPQESASFLYEDNDACTAMAMAQKPTTRTRHMDIKFHALCEWVERDLIRLERIDTTINMADHFTKSLSPILFRRHMDYIMGRVPPNYSQCNPTFRLSNKGDERRMDQALTPVVNRLVHTWTTIIGSSAS